MKADEANKVRFLARFSRFSGFYLVAKYASLSSYQGVNPVEMISIKSRREKLIERDRSGININRKSKYVPSYLPQTVTDQVQRCIRRGLYIVQA